MITHFDKKSLLELFQDFYNITKIRITILDDKFHEIVAYPESLPRFCQLIRDTSTGQTLCFRCDQNACNIAKGHTQPYIYRCHIGLTEVIAPLRLGNVIIGYLFLGHINNHANIPLPDNELASAFMELTCAEEQYILSASKLMEAVANYLCLRRMAHFKHDGLSSRIDAFIHENLENHLSNSIICQHFSLSRTGLYQLSMDLYGMGIMEYIKQERISLSKKLLLDTDLSIAEIAARCGIPDYNYFSKLFRKEAGITPRVYRKKGIH